MVVQHAGLGVVSVITSWAVVHTVYTLRYARLYYSARRRRGLPYSEPDAQPQFSDFAYLAFHRRHDVPGLRHRLRSATFRATVLRQALLSYLFGTVIVALAINLVAGLSR